MKIELPCDHEIRVDNVLDIAKKLIRLNYWDRIEIVDLDNWFDNFQNDEDRYFAAAILSSLIYRGQKSIDTFGANIIQLMLPSALNDDNIYNIENIETWECLLQKGKRSGIPIRFTAIEGVDGKPGKSGSHIYRKLCQKYFHKDLGILCENLQKEINQDPNFKALIIFDDIVGTGTQFQKFVNKHKLNTFDIKIYYFPFAAYQKTTVRLNTEYTNISVLPVEIITNTESILSSDTMSSFNQFLSENSPTTLKEYYLEICKKNNIKAKDKLGFGDLALTYIFNDSVPNNNIALLWYKSDDWNHLVER